MKPFLDIIINSKTEMKKFGHLLSNILTPGDVITLEMWVLVKLFYVNQ